MRTRFLGFVALGLAACLNAQTPIFGPAEFLVADPFSPDVLFAAGGLGVFRSEDGGVHWSATPLRSGTASLAADPSRAGTLYACTVFGEFFKSSDGGTSWLPVSVFSSDTAVQLVAVDRSGSFVYAAAERFQGGELPQGILRSADQGATWQQVGLAGLKVTVLVPDPTLPGLLYASGYRPGVSSSFVLLRSADAGVTWSTLAGPGNYDDVNVRWLAPDPTNPMIVYVSGLGGTVSRSSDGGLTWTALPAPPFFSNRLAIDSTNHSILYLATLYGAYKSLDAGRTWFFLTRGPQTVIAGLLLTPRGLFAGLGSSSLAVPAPSPLQVFGSSDGGDRWQGSGLQGPSPCGSAYSLCLAGGRFQVEVSLIRGTVPLEWERAVPVPIRSQTGAFWFFDSENLELMIKVLDGRAINGYFWVFSGGLSNLAYVVNVTDLESGGFWTFRNPYNQLVSVADTSAF